MKSRVTIPGLVTTYFKTTPKMSSFLLSLAVGHFDFVESAPTKGGTKITIYAPKGWDDPARCLIEQAVQAYDKIRDFFAGLEQPLKKIDIVSANMNTSAMENWDLITMRWDVLCGDRNHAVTVLTNVIIRFWLGNLVIVR